MTSIPTLSSSAHGLHKRRGSSPSSNFSQTHAQSPNNPRERVQNLREEAEEATLFEERNDEKTQDKIFLLDLQDVNFKALRFIRRMKVLSTQKERLEETRLFLWGHADDITEPMLTLVFHLSETITKIFLLKKVDYRIKFRVLSKLVHDVTITRVAGRWKDLTKAEQDLYLDQMDHTLKGLNDSLVGFEQNAAPQLDARMQAWKDEETPHYISLLDPEQLTGRVLYYCSQMKLLSTQTEQLKETEKFLWGNTEVITNPMTTIAKHLSELIRKIFLSQKLNKSVKSRVLLKLMFEVKMVTLSTRWDDLTKTEKDLFFAQMVYAFNRLDVLS